MILKMFSVFDSKGAIFHNPMFEQREESAIRGFCDAVNEQSDKNPLRMHPEDYSLFCLAEFDNETGEVIPFKVPKNLVTASAMQGLNKVKQE